MTLCLFTDIIIEKQLKNLNMKNKTLSKKEEHVMFLLLVSKISFLFLTVIVSILKEYPLFPKFFLDQIMPVFFFAGFYFIFHWLKNFELIANILYRPINRLLQMILKKFPPPTDS